MKLSIQISKEDSLIFQLFSISLSKQIKNQKLFMWIFGAILNYSIYIIISQIYHKYLFSSFVFVSCISLSWILAYPFYWKFVIKRRLKKMLRERLEKDNDEQYTISFNKNNISVLAKTNQSTINYNTLYSLVETPKYFYLFINKFSAFIVPENQMSEKEKLAFLSIIHKNNIRVVDQKKWKWSFFINSIN
ncbi:MAG: YcxB family protein [Spirochaetia bacterium]|nr:YcxB family protein [Spirochaetia bacterium]